MYIPADAAGSVPSAVMLTDFEQQRFQYLFFSSISGGVVARLLPSVRSRRPAASVMYFTRFKCSRTAHSVHTGRH